LLYNALNYNLFQGDVDGSGTLTEAEVIDLVESMNISMPTFAIQVVCL
jgi:hypothetical protein